VTSQEDCEKATLPNPDFYIRNLEALKARCVCLMSLGHFFRNDLVFPVEGISPDAKEVIHMSWTYTPDQKLPLKEIGKIVVQKMLDIGMIVDLTLSTPAARKDVFELNRRRLDEGKQMRPLTFTHTGAKYIFESTKSATRMPMTTLNSMTRATRRLTGFANATARSESFRKTFG